MSDDKTKEVKPKAEKPVKPAKLEQNGVTRPTANSVTGSVWSIADSLSAAKKAAAERSEVMEAAKKAGINDATAATQYGRWRKFFGIVTVKKTEEERQAEKATAAKIKAVAKQAKLDKIAAEKQAKKDAAAAKKAAAKPVVEPAPVDTATETTSA